MALALRPSLHEPDTTTTLRNTMPAEGAWVLLDSSVITHDATTAEQDRVAALREARWGTGGCIPECVRERRLRKLAAHFARYSVRRRTA